MLETNFTSERPAITTLALGPWTCCSLAAGVISDPQQLPGTDNGWLAAAVPGTVAGALAAAGLWDMQHPPAIDSQDWWYRTTFSWTDDAAVNQATWLCFDGLATLAEVWLNGQRLLSTDNMFRSYRVDVSSRLLENNELVIGFRSLSADLQQKRPRPRWKTNLVNQQQLRWQRTTLLGRIPGWSPPTPVIGPWRAVRLERSVVSLSDVQLNTSVDETTGVATLHAVLSSNAVIDRAVLKVGDHESPLDVNEVATGTELSGSVRLPDVPLWWPHTHGSQPLFACQAIVDSGTEQFQIDLGQVAFRSIKADVKRGFAIEVNGEPVFCRGGCWTASDVFNLNGTEESLRRDLQLARDAGANMLRVIGTMTYESDLFYQLCDQLGLLVWQDFMFANMDYPVEDPVFAENITAEATAQLRRLAAHPCVAVYCGNSEIEQQAAMLGMPREAWTNRWFAERLPALCAEFHPGSVYVPSTPTGGTLPFHPAQGICHYYGVGAYLRSPAELRQADVKFTPECLGFANIPEPDTINAITDGSLPVAHHPKWKQRIPRDNGAGWDFEDVRDHYLKQVFGVDPVGLRSTDMTRYLELSRVVTGEMMSATFSEWRGNHSHCQGGLVWFFKDLWPAAGWGVIDSRGVPKAAYYSLKRIWQNRQVTLTDEGLNGLHIHVINEVDRPLTGFVEVTLLKEPNIVVARQRVAVQLPGRGRHLCSADAVLGGFYDVNYAYRFGPAHHDLMTATLLDDDQQVISEAVHFVRRRESNIAAAMVDGVAESTGPREYSVTLTSDRFLHNVRLTATGYRPDDNYFYLSPQRSKQVRFTATQERPRAFEVEVEALNLDSPVTISVAQD